MNKNIFSSFTILLFLLLSMLSDGQTAEDCEAFLKNDTLVIRNSEIEQKWLWNSGNLIAFSIKKTDGQKSVFIGDSRPVFEIEGNSFLENIGFSVKQVAQNILMPSHLEVVVENKCQLLLLRQVFRIFPKTAAISCDYYLKYKSLFQQQAHQSAQVDGTEGGLNSGLQGGRSYINKLELHPKHWKIKTVEFKDATDVHDNLVFEKEVIPYRSSLKMTGNLLLATDLVSETSFFLLKEAPNSTSQISYPGFDFSVSQKEISVPFSGFPATSDFDKWVKGYTVTTGIGADPADVKMALRNYLKSSVNYKPEQYEMVMMNTWGDRGQDGRISEEFILDELERASQLGISHFQIDDGWQQGLSANSIQKSGNLWDAWAPENWQPNKERFPNGLDKIIQSAKEKHIRLGLWFHPSNENSYATWETDANVIVNLYKETGITCFKIDGVSIADKQAEFNLGRFFEKVKHETDGEVFFNLDLTAGIRGGYFSYRPFGNLFLENRYSDWGNYYPYHTLRNLWMLSEYFPPELLQVEFLNKWRNGNKYPADDPFAPCNYDFGYLFAITMAAQPLAWFEASGLPDDALPISQVIRKYREIQVDFHAGNIFPIGDEPCGRSWTGFQSIQGDRGYLLVFRENNSAARSKLSTFLPAGKRISLKALLGKNMDEQKEVVLSSDGKIEFYLPEVNSYVLYEYTIK